MAQVFDTLPLVAGFVSAQEHAEAWVLQCQAHHGQIAVVAGGGDVCPERAVMSLGRDRVLADVLEPARRAPDLIVGSWCGKKFRPEKVAAREGWATVPAVAQGRLQEIKSCDILQPGPAALTDGLEQLHRFFADWSASSSASA